MRKKTKEDSSRIGGVRVNASSTELTLQCVAIANDIRLVIGRQPSDLVIKSTTAVSVRDTSVTSSQLNVICRKTDTVYVLFNST